MGSLDGSSSEVSLLSLEDWGEISLETTKQSMGENKGFSATTVADLLVLCSFLDLGKFGRSRLTNFKYYHYVLFWSWYKDSKALGIYRES